MKTIKIQLLTLSLVFSQILLFAQGITHYPERKAGFWNFGIDAGLAYQNSTDVNRKLNGFGAGFTLGKNLYYRPHAIFSFDLRGRALYAQSFGLSGERNYGLANNNALNGVGRTFDADKLNYSKPNSVGYYFANYKTQSGALDLEGVLRFNRFREKTGIVLSLFGGVGLNLYQARINQSSSNGSYASAYKGVDSTSSTTAKGQLSNILDKSYETIADGNNKGGTLTWMPTLGIELGYQFAPRFHASLFHKVNYTRTDVFDGQRWTSNNTATAENDIQHYTGLKLEWELTNKKGGRPPRIEMIAPKDSPYYTSSPNVRVSATIKNIQNALDVRYKLNGVETQFDFYNPRLNSNILVNNGRNEVEIEATNPYGTDKKTIVIIYQEPKRSEPTPRPNPPTPPVNPAPYEPPMQRPLVKITNPSYAPYSVQNEYFTVKAEISNVKNDRDVRFFFNGRESNFSYYPNNGSFSANVNLQEGKNEIQIEVINPAGRDQAYSTINYERPRPQAYPPTVRLTSPSSNRESTENQYYTAKANVTNINNKNEITVRLNGRDIPFSYDNRRNTVSADLNLQEGNNNVEVLVNNADGNDRAQASIQYKKAIIIPPTPTEQRPEITIASPNRGQTFKTSSIDLEGKVLNVHNQSDVKVYVNNQLNASVFNIISKKVTSTVSLREGANTLTIKAENNAGKAEESLTVYYTIDKPKVNPPIVEIVNPNNGSTTSNDNTRVNARTSNLTGKNQVQIYVNNNRLNDFTYTAAGDVTFSTNLQLGDNTITIKAENEGGKAEKSITIKYNKPTKPKDDVIINPRNPTKTPSDPKDGGSTTGRTPREPKDDGSSTSTTPRIPRDTRLLKPTVSITSVSKSVGSPTKPATNGCSVLAKLKNVSSKGEITFTVNGKTIDFDYNASSGDFSADFLMEKGANVIVVSVKTSLGTASDTKTIDY